VIEKGIEIEREIEIEYLDKIQEDLIKTIMILLQF
jgi:hypothetical protein